MGILKKIISSRREMPTTKKNLAVGRPVAPCPNNHPGPTPPYGLHHWRDTFGNWHCTQCEPPATLSMVREEFLVELDAEKKTIQPPTEENFQLSPTMRVNAIKHLDGRWEFNPALTQAERRQAVDDDAWFDRQDERRRKKASVVKQKTSPS